jgi:hypothetical protein
MDTNSRPSKPNKFRPELIPRRGERIAWGASLLMLAAWAVLLALETPAHPLFMLLAVFLLLSALAISLGNWADRRTFIRLEADGVRFENGLRRAHLRWGEIRQVQVFPSTWGKKVRVLGEQAHFDFRTLGEVRLDGELKGRMGFADGELILQTILEKAALKEIEQPGKGYYYARE